VPQEGQEIMSAYKLFYFYRDAAEHYVQTCGVPFRDFIAALGKPPKNLLLLAHECLAEDHHPRTGFDYVTGPHIPKLAGEVSPRGGFCWVDFDNAAALDRLTPQDIAALLFFAHKGCPLDTPFSDTLKNRFAYTSHDDARYVRVYTKEPDAFLPVLSAAILSAADTVQAALRPLPSDKLAALWELASEGLLIDGSVVMSDDKTAELPFYIVGRADNMDEFLNHIDAHKQTAKKSGVIRFSLKPDPSEKAPPQKSPRLRGDFGSWRGKAATEGARSGKHLKHLQDIAKDIVNGLP
jgi:hypothetical protein